MKTQTRLIDVKENIIVLIEEILAGYRAHRFLADLGIHEGERVRVIRNDLGPIIVEIKGTRVAIGRGLAEKIVIQFNNK